MSAHVPHPRRLLAAGIAASALFVTTSVPSAQAATRTVHDKRGDSSAANDITRVRFDNGGRRIRVAVHYRDMGHHPHRPNLGAGVIVDVGRKGARAYELARYRSYEDDTIRVRLWRFTQKRRAAPYHRVHCPAKVVRAFPGPKSKVIYRLPQRCLGSDKGDAWFHVQGFRREGPPEPDVAPRKPVFVTRD
ncbi:MAG: hypothetical protein ACR2KG_05980 [Nocardioidaceae bacterium]